MDGEKGIVAHVFEATMFGPQYRGLYDIHLMVDVVRNKKVVVMREIPAYEPGIRDGTEGVVNLLRRRKTVVMYGEDYASRTGLHYVETAPEPIIVSSVVPIYQSDPYDVVWVRYTEDLPVGKVEYVVTGNLISDKIRPTFTVFLSTLRQLVSDSKAKIEFEDNNVIEFKINDDNIKEILRNYNLVDNDTVMKFKVPAMQLKNTIVVPI